MTWAKACSCTTIFFKNVWEADSSMIVWIVSNRVRKFWIVSKFVWREFQNNLIESKASNPEKSCSVLLAESTYLICVSKKTARNLRLITVALTIRFWDTFKNSFYYAGSE